MNLDPADPMTSTNPTPLKPSPFVFVAALAIWCLVAAFALIHLFAYHKRASARAEAYRATVMQEALGGAANFLRYEEARK